MNARFFVLAVVAACVVLTGCSGLGGKAVDPNGGKTSARRPHELVVETLEHVRLTIDAAGGTWIAGESTPWTWPQSTAGFTGVPCGDDSNQYSWDFTGPAEADPGAAAARVAAVWQKHGWRVRTIAPARPDDPSFTVEIAVDFADGGGLGYTANSASSGIGAQSACSRDPGMLTPSE